MPRYVNRESVGYVYEYRTVGVGLWGFPDLDLLIS